MNSSMTTTLTARRLKIATSSWSSSFSVCFTRLMPSRIQLVTRPVTISSAPSTQSGWPGASSAADITSGAMNSTRVCAALARRPWWPAILLAFSDTATNSSPVRAPLAPPVISAKPCQSAGVIRARRRCACPILR